MKRKITCTMKEVVQSNQIKFKKSQLFYLKIKRIIDILCSLLGMVVLSPIFLGAAIAIKIEEPGEKVFYWQDRIGRSGKPFRLYKFRTMRVNAPELSTNEFHDAETYITGVGKFMRSTSMDELPQLLNVLLGDMSLVGPRPLLPRERDVHVKRFLYGLYQVRPGITGMAQTHGRDEMEDEMKVRFDREYVENISFLTDFRLLFRTVFKVLKREGVRDGADTSGKTEKFPSENRSNSDEKMKNEEIAD